MKKILILLFIFLFKIEISFADTNEIFNNKSLNSFINQGYKITFVNLDAKSNILYYTLEFYSYNLNSLETDSKVIICKIYETITNCWKP